MSRNRRIQLALLISVIAPDTAPAARLVPREPAVAGFEENRGQSDGAVRFLGRDKGFTIFLAARETVLGFDDGAVLRWRLVGARAADLAGCDPLPAKASYFRGSDPGRWVAGAPTFREVEARQVYPGIDVIHYRNAGRLEYDFVVAPGGDPSRIALEIGGADALAIDPAGDLVIGIAGGGELVQHRPRAYQVKDGVEAVVTADYVLRGERRVGLKLGRYDRGRPLVVDPLLSYSTYLGGSGVDYGWGVAVDPAGNAYVTGETYSSDFPLAGTAPRSFNGGRDAFVTKYDVNGAVVYSTCLGGTMSDLGTRIAVDAAGNAYLVGDTDSSDFPMLGAAQGTSGGGNEAFVSKLDPGGVLAYSTYLGGNSDDFSSGIAVDGLGRAWVSGKTTSVDFPHALALQGPGGGEDAFVTRLSASGARLEFSTHLGGAGADAGWAIGVDAADAAYVSGPTDSIDFPTRDAFQGTKAALDDAFVTKINASGALVYSTYLGGDDTDQSFGLAVDAAGSAYVFGWTNSTDFPLRNAYQTAIAGAPDLFITKLDPSGGSLAYSTYLGAEGDDEPGAIALDADGHAFLSVWTDSVGFPEVDRFQAGNAGNYDAAVAKLGIEGDQLLYSSYLGGLDYDDAYGIAADGEGAAIVTGGTYSDPFPLFNAAQAAYGTNGDGYVTKVEGCPGGVPPRIDGLKLTRSGADLTLHWTDDAAAVSYTVYQGDRTDWTPGTPAGSAASGVAGLTMSMPAEPLLYFRVAGVGPCGDGPR